MWEGVRCGSDVGGVWVIMHGLGALWEGAKAVLEGAEAVWEQCRGGGMWVRSRECVGEMREGVST